MSRGVWALALTGVATVGTVMWVHHIQTKERKTMRQAVLRDIEKLGK